MEIADHIEDIKRREEAPKESCCARVASDCTEYWGLCYDTHPGRKFFPNVQTGSRNHLRFGFANQPNRQRGDKKRKCIEQYRDRCREQLNQDSGESRSDYLGDRAAESQFAIALEYLVALDKRGQIRLVGNIKEHCQYSGRRNDNVNLSHPQYSERRRDRD